MSNARKLPDVPRSPIPPGYAVLAAQGFDTYQEALDLKLSSRLIGQLEHAQDEAKKLDARGNTSVTTTIGGEIVQVRPGGMTGGVIWVFANDDFMVFIRSPKQDWNVSIRYLAAGLWEHGLRPLQARAHKMLFAAGALGRSPRYALCSRVDYAMDFHTPSFTPEMVPAIMSQFVLHARTKVAVQTVDDGGEIDTTKPYAIGRPDRIETWSSGTRGGLEVVVYDKTREIVEKSKKEWFYALWARNIGTDDADMLCQDVWRIECRFGKDGYLKNRNIRTLDDVEAMLPMIVGEALATRRLTVPSLTDSNKRRWPYHPLWSLALDVAGAVKMPPIGRYVTGEREDLAQKLIAGIAGNIRTLLVLKPQEVEMALESARHHYENDAGGDKKKRAAEERLKFVSEAQ